MKIHEAKEAIGVAEEAKTENVVQTNEPETVVEEKKPFWTKRKKIAVGVIAGSIVGGFLLKKFLHFDIEGDPETYRALVEDIITDETTKAAEKVAA